MSGGALYPGDRFNKQVRDVRHGPF